MTDEFDALTRSLAHRVTEIDTPDVLRLASLVGRLEQEAARRTLQAVIRPRLRMLRPDRPLTPQRLFCLPFEHLLVNHRSPARFGTPEVPRPAMARLWPLIADPVTCAFHRIELDPASARLCQIRSDPDLIPDTHWSACTRAVRDGLPRLAGDHPDDDDAARSGAIIVECLTLHHPILRLAAEHRDASPGSRCTLEELFLDLFGEHNRSDPAGSERLCRLATPLVGGPAGVVRVLGCGIELGGRDRAAESARRVIDTLVRDLADALRACGRDPRLFDWFARRELDQLLALHGLMWQLARGSGDRWLSGQADLFARALSHFVVGAVLPRLAEAIAARLDAVVAADAGRIATAEQAALERLFGVYDSLDAGAIGPEIDAQARSDRAGFAAALGAALDRHAAAGGLGDRLTAAGGLFKLFELVAGPEAAFHRLVGAAG